MPKPAPTVPAETIATDTAQLPQPRMTSTASAAMLPSRTVLSCQIKMAIVATQVPPLPVHSSPTPASDNILGTLANGTFVAIAQAHQDWWEITEPIPGWIPQAGTQSACSHKVERLQLTPQAPTIAIRDRFIGTGTHQYLIPAQPGQVLTLITIDGPHPRLSDPNGTALPLNPEHCRDRATVELAIAGDYCLEFDSQFRGYDYAFTLELS